MIRFVPGRHKPAALRAWLQPAIVERGFIGALAVLCILLAALQYSWTGQISHAANENLQAGFTEQVQAFCRAFDTDLSTACGEIWPAGPRGASGNLEADYAARVQRWLARQPRPMFRRIAVAVRSGQALQLKLYDAHASLLVPADWPPEWDGLRANLTSKARGGNARPWSDREGFLLESPVFGGGDGGESAWLILEIDRAYLARTWLPELLRTYLSRDGTLLGEVAVRPTRAPGTVLFASNPAATKQGGGRSVTVQFNNQGSGTFDEGPPDKRNSWTLTARPLDGALEAAVERARRRNLALAVVLIGLTLAAGLALVNYTRRSRKLAEAQLRFVANVSHELRTPLTVIRGAGHNLGRGIVREPAQVVQYARVILQHTDQLTAMVEQVLEYASGRAADRKEILEPVFLSALLKAAVDATAPDAAAAGCQVEVEIPPALPKIQGNAEALRRAFQNLISNAARHGGAGHWVGISAVHVNGQRPPSIEVRVADRGPGISRHEQAHIFEPFFRGESAQRRQIRGSGLGLSLVREIVKAHHGSVSVQSDGQHGATFLVRLPLPAEPSGGSGVTAPSNP